MTSTWLDRNWDRGRPCEGSKDKANFSGSGGRMICDMSVRRGEPGSGPDKPRSPQRALALVPQRSRAYVVRDRHARDAAIHPDRALAHPGAGGSRGYPRSGRGCRRTRSLRRDGHRSRAASARRPAHRGRSSTSATDGTCIGTVGGGAVERAVLESLVTTAKDPNAKHEVRTFKLGAELGMCCGGRLVVLGRAARGPRPFCSSSARVTSPPPSRCCSPSSASRSPSLDAQRRLGRRRPHRGTRRPLRRRRVRRGRASTSIRAAFCLVMTHDHALDQRAIERALKRGFAYVGGGAAAAAPAERTRQRLEAKGFTETDRAARPHADRRRHRRTHPRRDRRRHRRRAGSPGAANAEAGRGRARRVETRSCLEKAAASASVRRWPRSPSFELVVNGRTAVCRRRSVEHHPSPVAARHRQDRHQGRLRRGRSRRVHGGAARRRRPRGAHISRGQRVHHAAADGGGPRDRHRRRRRRARTGSIQCSRRWSSATASQCGYCTPGFVLSMFEAYYRSDLTDAKRRRTRARSAISSTATLRRCTGYRPIRDAMLDALAREEEGALCAFAARR